MRQSMSVGSMSRTFAATLLVAVLGLAGVVAGGGQRPLTATSFRNHPAIRYQEVPAQDAVTRLNERLASGEVTLEFEPVRGYLRSVLKAFGISEQSQLLVFSKTSLQMRKINPGNPRAIYFDDTISVGWVRTGDVLEVAVQDPRQGGMFYILEQNPDKPPRFQRDLSCVPCHTGDATMNVPGMFLSSVYPDQDGLMIFSPVFSSNHATGFDLRWGGWYVTGRHSLPRHLGNATVADGTWNEDMVTKATVHTTSLAGRFDPTGYISLQSDIVALMTLEHQSHMLNLITRLGWESRVGFESDAARDALVRDVVDYMLFVDEEPLPGPVAGTSAFAQEFAQRGPRDARGRSLREFDLKTRLMRYPCSYQIYSEPFEALPADLKAAVYTRIGEVLTGEDPDPRYASLAPADRQAILEILRETKLDAAPFLAGGAPVSP
jgi:hypothetical protein